METLVALGTEAPAPAGTGAEGRLATEVLVETVVLETEAPPPDCKAIGAGLSARADHGCVLETAMPADMSMKTAARRRGWKLIAILPPLFYGLGSGAAS